MKIKDFVLRISLLMGIFSCYASEINKESQVSSIVLRHSLDNYLGQQLESIIKKFNATHPDIQIILDYGGNYTESFEKTFQEKDRSKRPHLLLVAEYNTKTMFDRKGDYIPVDDIIDVKRHNFTPVIQTFYSFKMEGSDQFRMLSMPFACSTAVLYYNKEAFKKAELDPLEASVTWEKLEEVSVKLVKAGYKGFTMAWRPAYMFEHFATVHNLPFADPRNGFESGDISLRIDEKSYVEQLMRFVKWAKEGYYLDFKKNEDAEEAFANGSVAILMQGANREGILKNQIAKAGQHFELGVSAYPYSSALVKEPYALNIGGTSLWVLADHKEDQDKVKLFLNYLASPEIQAEWHQKTAYLPVTLDAYELTRKSDFYATHPAHAIACQQVIQRTANLPIGLRIPEYAKVRERISQAIDQVMEGKDAEVELKAVVVEAPAIMQEK